ncbi:SRPBCC family protein [Herbiconiux sp. CPCC 205763]|uniref:SRPBCC family protein n=1 Tax=Herbiconiux aconitum TaxID=2970913 RepID=A0ABT2GQ60_9MICO|nr:SRPBCC family protein [Herbiconiux aconitum]MCS5716911.1 SRPBCC family protein [Herbiconiux aconitum]
MGHPGPVRRSDVAGAVTIRRPVRVVFAVCSELRNLPRSVGDVVDVRPLGHDRYEWTVAGPAAIRVRLTVEVTAREPDRALAYRSRGVRGMRAQWLFRFEETDQGFCRVHETIRLPFGALGAAVLRAVGKNTSVELHANLRRLKDVLESDDPAR